MSIASEEFCSFSLTASATPTSARRSASRQESCRKKWSKSWTQRAAQHALRLWHSEFATNHKVKRSLAS